MLKASQGCESKPSGVVFGRFNWPQIIQILIAALVVYAIGSLLVSAPFMQRPGDELLAPLDHGIVMYMHGLTVGLAGLVALIASQVFELGQGVRKVILVATTTAIVVGMVGGTFNRTTESVWIWVQLVSFIALDVVLVALVIGLVKVKNSEFRRSITYWIALLSSISFLFAALTGDVTGWLKDFGEWPGIQVWYANLFGIDVVTLQNNLTAAHSHQIVVSILALLVAVLSWSFGRHLKGAGAVVRRLGEAMALTGTVVMMVMYPLEGYFQPLFNQPVMIVTGPINIRHLPGLMTIDVVTGVGIMFGGLLILAAIAFGKRLAGTGTTARETGTLTGIMVTWLALVVVVAGTGYFIQLNMDLYSGPREDFIQTYHWLHQDLGFFLFPAVVVMMIFAQRWVTPKPRRIANALATAGVITCLAGALVYSLVNPTEYGPGYWITGAGFVLILAATVIFLVGTLGRGSKHLNTPDEEDAGARDPADLQLTRG